MVSVSVGDGGNRTSSVLPCRINPSSNIISLPQETIHAFIETLEPLGFRIGYVGRGGEPDLPDHTHYRGDVIVSTSGTGEATILRIVGADEDELRAILPTLHYFIHLENGESIRIPLYPHDYINVSSVGRHFHQVLFAVANSVRPFVIGSALLSTLALHIDPHRGRVGFADPDI